jgi:SIR2-like protein
MNTLRSQIASKSLLFIGFSLDDEHLELQLRSVNDIYKDAVGPHYAIVREEHSQRVQSLKIEPLAVRDFDSSLMGLITDLEAAAQENASVSVTVREIMKPR